MGIVVRILAISSPSSPEEASKALHPAPSMFQSLVVLEMNDVDQEEVLSFLPSLALMFTS